jgi:hypothetical protein
MYNQSNESQNAFSAKLTAPPAPRLNVALMRAIQQRMCNDAKPVEKVKLVALPWAVIKTGQVSDSIFNGAQGFASENLKTQLTKHF